MKIEIEIPDWCDERHIYVLAGIELAAIKYKDEEWLIKSGRCDMCGRCCSNFKRNLDWTENGVCIFLKKQGNTEICSLGVGRPFRCCVGINPKGLEGCAEKFEKIK